MEAVDVGVGLTPLGVAPVWLRGAECSFLPKRSSTGLAAAGFTTLMCCSRRFWISNSRLLCSSLASRCCSAS